MSKAYKGKPCVYCAAVGVSSTPDHVVARAFFPPPDRKGLPIVPACESCNNEKSRIEHYLTTVMPFGGQHASATETLQNTIPKLKKNMKLTAQLDASLKRKFVQKNGGPWEIAGEIELDGEKLTKLYEYILRGLAFHHWGLLFDASHFLAASYVTVEGASKFEEILQTHSCNSVEANLAHGGFVYRGIQSAANSAFTVWRMSLYGAKVNGGTKDPGGKFKNAYGFTSPKSLLAGQLLSSLLTRN